MMFNEMHLKKSILRFMQISPKMRSSLFYLQGFLCPLRIGLRSVPLWCWR